MRNTSIFKKAMSLIIAGAVTLTSVTSLPLAELKAQASTIETTSDTQRVYTHDNYRVQYDVNGSWTSSDETYQNVQITITNTGANAIENWAFAYDFGGEVQNIWSAEIGEMDGTKFVQNNGQNHDIDVNANVNFGYTLKNAETSYFPGDFVLVSQRVSADSARYNASLNITNDWGAGFSGELVIHNLSDTIIRNPELSFGANFEITSAWGFDIVSSDSGNYIIKAKDDNRIIPVGGSVTLGFNGAKEVGTDPYFGGSSLTEIRIGNAPEPGGDTDEPKLPDGDVDNYGIDKLVAFGAYNSENNSINLKWTFNDMDGIFTIYSVKNGEYTQIGTVENKDEYQIEVSDTGTHLYAVGKIVDDKVTYSNIVTMIYGENGYEQEFLDSDNDGLADILEYIIGTAPNNPDTDGDSLTDGEEVNISNTDPLKADTDDNGISDADEDFDNDGLNTRQEIDLGTDVFYNDTDNDTLLDGDEINTHGTDPLKADTDDDKINDNDELTLGLDPLNPATHGVPDNEYIISQSLDSNNSVFSEFNTDENFYDISLDVDAGGLVERNLEVKETGYAKTISNDAVVGIAPEFIYDGFKVDSATIKFAIKPDYVAENLSDDTGKDDFNGIKRLNVFKYFEDLNMLLPIKTDFNTDTNTISADVDSLGTYCVMDMVKWLNILDINIDDFELAQPQQPVTPAPLRGRMLSNFAADENADSGTETGGAIEYANDDSAAENSSETDEALPSTSDFSEDEMRIEINPALGDDYVAPVTANIRSARALISTIDENAKNNIPVDVVFLLQTSGKETAVYNGEVQMIKDVAEKVFKRYPNSRIAIVEYNYNGASYLNSVNGNNWADSKSKITEMLDTVNYVYYNDYTNRGYAFNFLLNNVTFRDNTAKFVYQVMNGSTDVASGYFSQLETCDNKNIIYSEVMPQGYVYLSSVYGDQVKAGIAKTAGIFVYFDTTIAQKIITHIIGTEDNEIKFPAPKFNAITTAGYSEIELNDYLNSANDCDTDGDGLTDWREIRTEWLSLVTNPDGSQSLEVLLSGEGYVLPTFHQIISSKASPEVVFYVESGMEKYKKYIGATNGCVVKKPIDEYVFDAQILPINSDPTNIDSDGDGFSDIEEVDYDKFLKNDYLDPLKENQWEAKSELAPFFQLANYSYNRKNDTLISNKNNILRFFGYSRVDDNSANKMIGANITAEPIYFIYAGKEWLIELWKGQYGAMTGAEIGVYNRPHKTYNDFNWFDKPVNKAFADGFNFLLESSGIKRDFKPKEGEALFVAVNDNEMLESSFDLAINETGRPFELIFNNRPTIHWWNAEFMLGSKVDRGTSLLMTSTIKFDNNAMLDAFRLGTDKSLETDITSEFISQVGVKNKGLGLANIHGFDFTYNPTNLTVKIVSQNQYLYELPQTANNDSAVRVYNKYLQYLASQYNKSGNAALDEKVRKSFNIGNRDFVNDPNFMTWQSIKDFIDITANYSDLVGIITESGDVSEATARNLLDDVKNSNVRNSSELLDFILGLTSKYKEKAVNNFFKTFGFGMFEHFSIIFNPIVDNLIFHGNAQSKLQNLARKVIANPEVEYEKLYEKFNQKPTTRTFIVPFGMIDSANWLLEQGK